MNSDESTAPRVGPDGQVGHTESETAMVLLDSAGIIRFWSRPQSRSSASTCRTVMRDTDRSLAAAGRLVDRLGERPGMGCEALVIPREADRRDAKALGQRQRGQVRHLAVGGLPNAHGDPRQGRPQRGNIGVRPMVAGSRWARKKSELACIQAIPSSLLGGICEGSGIGGACSWLGGPDSSPAGFGPPAVIAAGTSRRVPSAVPSARMRSNGSAARRT